MKTLILNQYMKNFTGSEINAVQLADCLQKRGEQVDIGTFIIKDPICSVLKQYNINTLNLYGDHFQADYDLVWAHHAPTLTYYLYYYEVAKPKVIFSSLSTIINLEAPPFYIDEIPLFLSHNPVNTKTLVANGVPQEKIHYFPNYAPSYFFDQPRETHHPSPRKIAVISNHPPIELRCFAQLVKTRNVDIRFIGVEDKSVFIDENVLNEFDLVVTIGKTVIYCFAMKIPVYCYDHFGGPGYITPENFEMSREHNFSGLGFNRFLNAEELEKDIFSQYRDAVEHLDYLHEQCRTKFNLERNLDVLMQRVEKLPELDIVQFRKRNSLAKRTYGAYMDAFNEMESFRNRQLSVSRRVFNYLLRKVRKYVKWI